MESACSSGNTIASGVSESISEGLRPTSRCKATPTPRRARPRAASQTAINLAGARVIGTVCRATWVTDMPLMMARLQQRWPLSLGLKNSAAATHCSKLVLVGAAAFFHSTSKSSNSSAVCGSTPNSQAQVVNWRAARR